MKAHDLNNHEFQFKSIIPIKIKYFLHEIAKHIFRDIRGVVWTNKRLIYLHSYISFDLYQYCFGQYFMKFDKLITHLIQLIRKK
jgi:hypothetical protein